ncbi:MAG: hypothetical protein KGL74_04740, partial [Elusimicrobia bacterium]|nr:hypothetical protein [Elusimicrobiota bacterium]
MTEAEFAREWTAFGGASLALMGAALAFGARRYADDHLDWQRQWSRAAGRPEPPPADPGPLARAYRRIGAVAALT